MNKVSLSKLSATQKIVLSDFYSKPSTKVAFNTAQRKEIWDQFKSHREVKKFRYLDEEVPAIFAEISKAILNEKNLQPAVFSECAYAQAFADKFNLFPIPASDIGANPNLDQNTGY